MKEGEVINPPASVSGFGIRHGQILLQILFNIIISGIQMSLAITIPAMLQSDPTFADVSVSTVSQMFQSYMIGFLLTELLGGFVCKRYGFKWPMVILMVVISAVTLNLPTLSNEYGVNAIIVCRILQGLCIGLLFSMPAEVISRWVPVKERTILGTAVYASGFLGGAIATFGGTYLSKTNLNWSFVYMQYGYLAIIWVVLMVVFGADSPEEYPRKISGSELDYIVHNRGNLTIKKKLKVPWRQIFTSIPFWAIVVAQLGANWMLFVLSTNIPPIMRLRFNVHVTPNILSSINLITWVLSFSISGIAQLLISEERTTIGQSRKLFNTLGSCIPAFFLLLLAFVLQGNQYVGIAVWVIISVSSIGTFCGSRLNSNDITTNFAPIIYGTATWIGSIFNLVSVAVLHMHVLDDWIFVFTYTAILLIVTNLFYLRFGSGEEQDWSLYEDLEEEDFSKSTSMASVDEGKYLLYVRKQ